MLNKQKNTMEDVPMPILDHIKELRMRLIIVIVTWVLLAMVAFPFSEWLFNAFLGDFARAQFIYLTPAALFMTYLKLSMTLALLFVGPLILYQTWAFIKPGLHKHEKHLIVLCLIFGSLLFYLGCFFAYRIAIPFSLRFFEGFSGERIQAQYDVSQYMGFVINMMLVSGFIFELPLLMSLLAAIGIVPSKLLAKNRKYIILIIFTISAVLTPPDVLSQMLMALPLCALFELGLVAMKQIERVKKKRKLFEKNKEYNR